MAQAQILIPIAERHSPSWQQPEAAGAATSNPPGYHWIVLGVLFITRFSLGFQFQSAGSVGPLLIAEWGLDYAQVGTLIGLYMLPGLIVAMPSGLLAKRHGDKSVVAIGLCAMMLGGIICGAAASYAQVALGRFVSGTGAVIITVLMNKMITDWFADKQLFIGMSIFIIGWPVGIAAAQATQGQFGQTFGWSAVFHLTTMSLAGALVLVALFYRPAHIGVKKTSVAAPRLARSEIWLICVAGWIWMFLNGAYVVMLGFGPALMTEHGASMMDAARAASLMSWVFFFALPVSGYVATRFKAPNIVMVGGLAVSVLLCALIPLLERPHLPLALFGIAFALATPVIGSLPSEALRRENRATGFGLYYLWYYGGVAIAPVIAGWLKDVTGSAASAVYFATIMMFACLMLVGMFRRSQSQTSFGPGRPDTR